MKKFPPMIQRSAGSHPKVIPMNGPKIGPRAATLLNWYPHRTYRLTGKYSTPSMYMWAGVAFFASDRHTFRSTHFPYPQYATPYSPIVTTTHRNGVDRMSTTVPPPGSRNPMRGAATVILAGRLNLHVYPPRPNPPTGRARKAPLTAAEGTYVGSPLRERGDATPASPASRPPAGDFEAVRACVRSAIHEPERRGAEGRRVARDAGLRTRERGSGASDRGRLVPRLRGPRPDRGRRTRFAERRVARPPPPRRQGLCGHRGRPRCLSRPPRVRSGKGGRLASALDPSVDSVTSQSP